MCGRYVLKSTIQELKDTYSAIQQREFQYQPLYNVAPTLDMPIVFDSDEGGRVIDLYRWGLVPFWAKEIKVGYSMINARAETLASKKTFTRLFKRKRCIVPANGFYEWKKTPDGKIPHYITLRDKGIISFAGLYEHWKSSDGEQVDSFTIITTEANEIIKPLHDRMPAILILQEVDEWLNPENQNSKSLQELLRPYPDDDINYRSVSTKINNPRNQGSELID
ncbi:MAG: SOS response-associated peptidase [Balneolaceae bacterium]